MAAPERPIVYKAVIQPQGKRLKVPLSSDGTVEDFLNAVKKRAPYAVKGIDVETLQCVREEDMELCPVDILSHLVEPNVTLTVCPEDYEEGGDNDVSMNSSSVKKEENSSHQPNVNIPKPPASVPQNSSPSDPAPDVKAGDTEEIPQVPSKKADDEKMDVDDAEDWTKNDLLNDEGKLTEELKSGLTKVFNSFAADGKNYLIEGEVAKLVKQIWNWGDAECRETAINLIAEFGEKEDGELHLDEFLHIYETSARENPMACRRELAKLNLVQNFSIRYQTLENCLYHPPKELKIPFDINIRDFKCLIAEAEGVDDFKAPRPSFCQKEMQPMCFCENTSKIYIADKYKICRKASDGDDPCDCGRKHLTKEQLSDNCSFCTNKLDATCGKCSGDECFVIQSGCGHVFHAHCFADWSLSKNCPVCRATWKWEENESDLFILPVYAVSSETDEMHEYLLEVTTSTTAKEIFQMLESQGAKDPWNRHLRFNKPSESSNRRGFHINKSTEDLYSMLGMSMPDSLSGGSSISASSRTLKQLKIINGTSLSLCEAKAHQFTVEVTVQVPDREQNLILSLASNTKISEVASNVSKKLNLDKKYPLLLFEGEECDPELVIADYSFAKTRLKLICTIENVAIDLDFFTCTNRLPGNSNILMNELIATNETIYVSKRYFDPSADSDAQMTNVDQLCTKDLSWIPIQCAQSDKGMAQFLCCMYKACHLKDGEGKRISGHFRRLLIDWPPFANSLNLLVKKMFHQIHLAEKALLSNTMFLIIENIIPNISNLTVERGNYFEYSRIILAAAEQSAQSTDINFENFDTLPLTCEKSQDILEDPVLYEDNYYSRDNLLADETIDASKIEECKNIAYLLETYPNLRQVVLWKSQKLNWVNPGRTLFDLSWTGFKQNSAKNKAFAFVQPVSLGVAQSPAMTLNNNGNYAIFKGHTPCAMNEKDLFDPITGKTLSLNPDSYAANLGNIEDERDILEGIYVVLDTSQSMCGHSGFVDQKDLKDGNIVSINGLKNQRKYNGSDGQIVGDVNDRGRYPIMLLDENRIIHVKPANLTNQPGHYKLEGWDNRPIRNETEEAKDKHLKHFASDPLMDNYRQAVKAAVTAVGNTVLAKKMVLEEIAAMYKEKDFEVDDDDDEDACEQMSRYITQYQDEFGQILINSMDNLYPHDDESEDNDFSSKEDIPHEFMCPITRALFTDPVVAGDGCTYERQAIRTWFQNSHTSPMYGTRIRTNLVTNQNLKTQIHDWKEQKNRELRELRNRQRNESIIQWQLFARCNGVLHNLHVTPNTTVEELLSQLSLKTELPPKFMMLRTLAGRLIRDDSLTLRACGLQNESTVSIQIRHGSRNRNVAMCIKLEKVYPYHSLVFLSHEDETFEVVSWKIWCSVLRQWPDDERQYRPSKFSLWKELRPTGDNYLTGNLLQLHHHIRREFHGQDWDSVKREMKMRCRNKKPKTGQRKYMTRLECVKQLFQAFINRSQGYHYANHIGLITFGSNVTVECKISPFYEKFRDAIESASADGETKLFDAMNKGLQELLNWHTKYPNAKLRMLVLSDGKDTNSDVSAWTIASKIQQHGIIVDAVNIGGESDRKLHAIAKCSGGYIFYPETLVTALKLNELETFLSQVERPPKATVKNITRSRDLDSFEEMKADRCDDDVVPPRKPNATSFQSVTGLAEVVNSNMSRNLEGLPRQKRIMRELKLLHRQPHPHVDVFPCEDDINSLQILMQGPAQTPYVGGSWLIDITFGRDYPDVAPEMRFRTPIRHCNINSYGRVCHSIFNRDWSADMTLKRIIECVYGLLLTPDREDPLDSALASSYYDDLGTYENVISTHTAKHAMKRTREEWNELLLQESTDEEKMELALKRDMIRRQEKPYEQESSDYCFHCKSKNTLKRCETCHLALFCVRSFNRCKKNSGHVCFDLH